MSKQKILLICSDSNSVVNFRTELIRHLKEKGCEVSLIVGDEDRINDLKPYGIDIRHIPFTNRDKNPFHLLRLIRSLKKEIISQAPDVVFTFQIKANICGSIAAAKAKQKRIYAMIEGVGDPFQPKKFKERLIKQIVCWLYRKSLRHCNGVFFLNKDDSQDFRNNGLVKEEQVFMINGIGIDTSSFHYDDNVPSEKRIACLSRLIKNKGVFEFCKIADIVRKTRPDIIFDLYGQESEIKSENLKFYLDRQVVHYHGFIKDVSPVFAQCRIVCSTSYREGFPRVIMEAMASGKTVVASDVIGNRSAIHSGVDGFLLPLDDLEAFAKFLIEVIDNTDLLKRIGANAHRTCLRDFDSHHINERIYQIISR